MSRTRNKTNVNKLIIENAKLLQADNNAMREKLLKIQELLDNRYRFDTKEELINQIEKILKL